jgi:two-component system nitrate/nitrite response regulator NarL
MFRDGIKRALESRPEFLVVGEAVQGDDALWKIRRFEPDVALLDATMPGLDGTDLIRTMRREGLATRLVVWGELARRVVADGVAHVAATAEADEICDALAAVVGGERPSVAAPSQGSMSGDGRAALSSREQAVLVLTADGRGTAAIGRELHISEATVKTHLRHIYRKLGVSNRAAAVAGAIRRGLID